MTPPEAATSPWTHAVYPGRQEPQRGKGLAITAIVLSTLALTGVVIVAALAGLLFFAGAGYDNYTLRGSAVTAEGQVADGELELAIRAAVEQDGGTPSKIECPESSKVGSGLSVMCDATIDDAGWVAVVVFEKDQGEFTLALY